MVHSEVRCSRISVDTLFARSRNSMGVVCSQVVRDRHWFISLTSDVPDKPVRFIPLAAISVFVNEPPSPADRVVVGRKADAMVWCSYTVCRLGVAPS